MKFNNLRFYITGKRDRRNFYFWGKSIGLSVVDQGVFSGANFVMNILLARWLSPETFGDFSVMFSFFLLISSIQNSIALEPMSVFGLSRHHSELKNYVDLLFVSQFVIMLLIGVSLILISFFSKNLLIGRALVGLGVGIPFILNLWFLRRVFYLKGQIELSILCSMVYAITMLAGMMIFNKFGYVDAMSAFMIMAGACFLGSIIAACILKINPGNGIKLCLSTGTKTVFLETWDYCRWVLLTVIVNWVASLSVIPIINIFSGADQAAAYRSIQVLYLPIQQVLTAFQLFFLPWVSKEFSENGNTLLHKQTKKVMMITTVFVLAYLLVIQIIGKWIISIFYNSEFYNRFTWLLPYFSTAIFIGAVVQVLSISLRAVNKPSAIFYAKTWATIFVLLVGIFLIYQYNLIGAVIASLGSVVVETIVIIYFYKKDIFLQTNGEFEVKK